MDTHRIYRYASFLEGLSLLVVAGVSTPMKHVWGVENAAQITGMIHGIFWLAYMLALMNVASDRNWPWSKAILYGVLASIPFGFVWIEARERKLAEAPTLA